MNVLPWELVGRIAVSALLGGAIGYEREHHGHPAGLRTHLLVSITAATFMVVSTHFVYFQRYGEHELVEVDPSRIASTVVSGIGFLAGGAIFRTGATVRGLTTAAGLWLVTAVGMSAGAGMYLVASAVTAFGLLALTLLQRLEPKRSHTIRRRVSVVLGEGGATIPELLSTLRAARFVVGDMEYERRFDDKRRVVATFDVALPDAASLDSLVATLERMTGVRRVSVRAPA